MVESNVDYTEADIECCAAILDEHLVAISSADNATSAAHCVQTTVIKLNELNNLVGGDLIETDQREKICEFIISAGALLGFNGKDEDVTEEWREW